MSVPAWMLSFILNSPVSFAIKSSVQWNLDLTKCQGTGEIVALYRRFVIENLVITNLRRNNQNVGCIEI